MEVVLVESNSEQDSIHLAGVTHAVAFWMQRPSDLTLAMRIVSPLQYERAHELVGGTFYDCDDEKIVLAHFSRQCE